MDEAYYHFVLAGRRESNGLRTIGPQHLVPLKARAWLDLSRRAEAGEKIDAGDIKKHKNDVFRLYQLLDAGSDPHAPESVKVDLRTFVDCMRMENVDLKALKIAGGRSRDDILDLLVGIYRL